MWKILRITRVVVLFGVVISFALSLIYTNSVDSLISTDRDGLNELYRVVAASTGTSTATSSTTYSNKALSILVWSEEQALSYHESMNSSDTFTVTKSYKDTTDYCDIFESVKLESGLNTILPDLVNTPNTYDIDLAANRADSLVSTAKVYCTNLYNAECAKLVSYMFLCISLFVFVFVDALFVMRREIRLHNKMVKAERRARREAIRQGLTVTNSEPLYATAQTAVHR